MATTADFRTGMIIQIDGNAYRIVDFQHVKPGKGGAFVRTKLKNVETGAVLERTLRAGEKVDEIRLERSDAQYLYSDGELLHFMNMETYDQFALTVDKVGDARFYMKENEVIGILTRDGSPFLIELPPHVTLAVAKTEPGLRGDTATGANKPAELETGLTVAVPLFIDVGDTLKIDTRTGEYIERVSR
ncbi:MAG: elongation factor P [Candidatus Eisenbacteria bacterium]